MRHIFIWSDKTTTLYGEDLSVFIAEVETRWLGDGKTEWQVDAPMFTLALDKADQLFDADEDMIMVHRCPPREVWLSHEAMVLADLPENRCSEINTRMLEWAKEVEFKRVLLRTAPVTA